MNYEKDLPIEENPSWNGYVRGVDSEGKSVLIPRTFFNNGGAIIEFIYYGKNTTGNFPTEAEVLNGTKYTGDVNDGLSVPPNTGINEYGWFAIPVSFSAPFTAWGEVGSSTNKGAIGAEGSAEFIVIKTNTVLIDGVSCYIYMYNWAGEFSNILKLYVL